MAVILIGGFVVALPLLLSVLPAGIRLIYHWVRLPELLEDMYASPFNKPVVGRD